MKLIKSKVPLNIGRKSESHIIGLHIREFTWDEVVQRYKVVIVDYTVTEVVFDAADGGSTTTQLQEIDRNTRYRTPEEINQMFNHFGVTIAPGEDFTAKFKDLQIKGLLLDTQQDPVYGSAAGDWEIAEII